MTERHGRAETAPRGGPREAWFFTLDGETFAILEEALAGRALPASLTEAERAVAAYAAAGLGNVEIAGRRGCGASTVSKQLSSVYRKLGLCGREALQAWLADRDAGP